MRVQDNNAEWKFLFALLAGLLLFPRTAAFGSESSPSLTNAAQLRLVAAQNPTNSFSLQLEGTVLWADAAGQKLVLTDVSGMEAIQLASDGPALKPGERIRIEGKATVARSAALFRIGASGPVVDNNGVHPMIEMSGAIFLEAGWQPLEVDWFNGAAQGGLGIEYEAPGLPRQKVPATHLYHFDQAADGTAHLTNGLEFLAYEGTWQALPDFGRMIPVRRGVVSDFDISVVSRSDHVGLRFRGFLKIPAEGLYIFHL
ncbi:MAG: hypothetical protein H7Y43_02755, partial [Akkermansiaceae bacterium]|nr:hypothetical protein [Verrucomicrobiales bacterium]